jgi:hypothetical protein
VISIGDKDVFCRVRLCPVRHDLEAALIERVGWIDNFNLGDVFFYWVIEVGIKLMARSTTSATTTCKQPSAPFPQGNLFGSG